MDRLHTLFKELEPKLKELTLEETAQLAGMILNECGFGIDPKWSSLFVTELDQVHVDELWGYLNWAVFRTLPGETTLLWRKEDDPNAIPKT